MRLDFETRDRLAPGLQEIGDVDALPLDQPLPLVVALVGVGREGAREPLDLRGLGRIARVMQDDRLDAEQRARMKGVIEYRDRDAALVDPAAVETHAHLSARFVWPRHRWIAKSPLSSKTRIHHSGLH